MAINKNHLFEDIEGIKCAVVEAGVNTDRMNFLKSLLEFNGFTVIVAAEVEKKVPVPVPPPAPAGDISQEHTPPPPLPPAAPEPPVEPKYKIGVTDVTFNATNAIFGRLLKTNNGRIVTMAFWLQKETVSNDEIPYFENKNS